LAGGQYERGGGGLGLGGHAVAAAAATSVKASNEWILDCTAHGSDIYCSTSHCCTRDGPAAPRVRRLLCLLLDPPTKDARWRGREVRAASSVQRSLLCDPTIFGLTSNFYPVESNPI